MVLKALDPVMKEAEKLEYEQPLSGVLETAEQKIRSEYDRLIKDLTTIEHKYLEILQSSPYIKHIKDEREELKIVDMSPIVKFDKELDGYLKKLLNALITGKYSSVEDLLDENSLKEIKKKHQDCEEIYDRQQDYMINLEKLKLIKPKITCTDEDINSIIMSKDAFDDSVKLRLIEDKSNSISVLDPRAKSLLKHDTTDLVLPSKSSCIVIFSDALVICGGKNEKGKYQSVCYFYLEETKKLVVKACMLQEKAYHALTFKNNSLIFSVGGENGSGLINWVERYNIKNDKWEKLPRLSERKKNVALCLIFDMYLYSIGGICKDNKESRTIEMLHIVDGHEWEVKEMKEVALRNKAGCIALNDTQILIFGGKIKGKEEDSTEIYDIDKGCIINKSKLAVEDVFNRMDIKRFNDLIYVAGRMKGVHVYDINKNHWNFIEEDEFTTS
jgi:hypothetical protein